MQDGAWCIRDALPSLCAQHTHLQPHGVAELRQHVFVHVVVLKVHLGLDALEVHLEGPKVLHGLASVDNLNRGERYGVMPSQESKQ